MQTPKLNFVLAALYVQNYALRTRIDGYELDPKKENVTWYGDSRSRCINYLFNTKQKDQMFCPKCGTSLGIDFRNNSVYGISVSDSSAGSKLP
jgi:hypothetical protein